MAEVIRFFPRQAVVGTETTATNYYSEIFDASDYLRLKVLYRRFAVFPSSLSGSFVAEIQSTNNPELNDDAFETLGTLTEGAFTTFSGGLGRYVRAKVTVSGAMSEGSTAMIQIEGVANET